MKQRTTILKAKDNIHRWYVVNADSVSVGRLASRVAHVLRGKNLKTFTPSVSHNNHVIVINASRVKFSGNKYTDKKIYRHTGYTGGIKSLTYRESFEKSPARFVEKMIKGMLPKTSLGRSLRNNLKVYAGETHSHTAQTPVMLDIFKN